MAISQKSFCFGLLVGIAVSLVTLELVGRYYEQTVSARAQVHLLRALPTTAVWPAQMTLAHPVFPNDSREVWQLRQMNGGAVRISDFKGKAVFLNYWSTTCAPCIGEMPSIERLHESLKNEAVSFLAVTRDDEGQVRSFVKHKPIKVPIYFSSKDVPQYLRAGPLPTTYILDKDGAIAFMHIGALDWDDDKARQFLREISQRLPTR